MDNSSMSVLTTIAQASLLCPACTRRFTIIDIVDPMSQNNLVAYPAVGTAKYCPHCQHPLTTNRKLLMKAPTWEPTEFYQNEQVVKRLGPWSRPFILQARKTGELPHQRQKFSILYRGSDLNRWVATLPIPTRKRRKKKQK